MDLSIKRLTTGNGEPPRKNPKRQPAPTEPVEPVEPADPVAPTEPQK